MATIATISNDARKRLRDFGKFFQASFTPSGRTYQLGHVNVDPESLWVAYLPTAGSASATTYSSTDYALDARNGLVRFPTVPTAYNIMVEGYHYEWLLPEDLEFAAEIAINEMLHGQNVSLADLSPAVEDVVVLGTVVESLWALLNEYARDIDVISSESVHITASQRYRMVSDLLNHWDDEYRKKMQALNLGLDRIEVLTLRRVSRTTNRLVPIYKAKEVGDYGPLERVFPDIDDGIIELTEEDDLRSDVYVEGEPPPGFLTTGYY
jgi:hypothetical protein